MFQVPTGIWQEIAAAHPEMKSRWGKAMAGGQEAIDRLLADVSNEQEGLPSGVTLAFQITAPLVVENAAIQAWCRETNNLGLRAMVLLDLLTPKDAALVGAMEYRLEGKEQALLESLVAAEIERQGAGPPGPTSSPSYALLADGAQLREGLKRFRAMQTARKSERAHFAFDGAFLTVDALGCAFGVRATGSWPGTARCSTSTIAALAAVPPEGVEVALSYEQRRLRIGTLTVASEWTPVSGALLALPAAPDWVEALSLKYRVHRSKLLHSGCLKEVDAAEAKLDATIAKATKPLAPLGITEADVRKLVDEALAARWRGEERCLGPAP